MTTMQSPPILAHFEDIIPPTIKGLIFDCDGTLIDTMPIHFQAWSRALSTYGFVFPEDRFYSFAGMPTVKIVEILSKEQKIEVDAAAVAHEKEEIYIKMMPSAAPIREVIAIARREKGHRKIAVASGGWHAIVQNSLNVIGCGDLFEAVVGADEVEHGKPHPDMFLEAARRIGVDPKECLVFEDGEMGFQAAHAAGMQVVDVRPWYLPRKK